MDDIGNYEIHGDVVQFNTPPSAPKKYLSESPGLGTSFVFEPITSEIEKPVHLNAHISALNKFSLADVFKALYDIDPVVDMLYKERNPTTRLKYNNFIQSTNNKRFEILHSTATQIQSEPLPVGMQSYFNKEYKKIMAKSTLENMKSMYFLLFYFILFSFILFYFIYTERVLNAAIIQLCVNFGFLYIVDYKIHSHFDINCIVPGLCKELNVHIQYDINGVKHGTTNNHMICMNKKHRKGRGVIVLKKANNTNQIQHVKICDNTILTKVKFIIDTKNKLIYFFYFLLFYFIFFCFILYRLLAWEHKLQEMMQKKINLNLKFTLKQINIDKKTLISKQPHLLKLQAAKKYRVNKYSSTILPYDFQKSIKQQPGIMNLNMNTSLVNENDDNDGDLDMNENINENDDNDGDLDMNENDDNDIVDSSLDALVNKQQQNTKRKEKKKKKKKRRQNRQDVSSGDDNDVNMKNNEKRSS